MAFSRSSVILVLALMAGCTADNTAPVPEGLTLTVQSDRQVEGTFAQGGDWIKFRATVAQAGHPEVVVSGKDGVVLRSIDQCTVKRHLHDPPAVEVAID